MHASCILRPASSDLHPGSDPELRPALSCTRPAPSPLLCCCILQACKPAILPGCLPACDVRTPSSHPTLTPHPNQPTRQPNSHRHHPDPSSLRLPSPTHDPVPDSPPRLVSSTPEHTANSYKPSLPNPAPPRPASQPAQPSRSTPPATFPSSNHSARWGPIPTSTTRRSVLAHSSTRPIHCIHSTRVQPHVPRTSSHSAATTALAASHPRTLTTLYPPPFVQTLLKITGTRRVLTPNLNSHSLPSLPRHSPALWFQCVYPSWRVFGFSSPGQAPHSVHHKGVSRQSSGQARSALPADPVVTDDRHLWPIPHTTIPLLLPQCADFYPQPSP